MLVEAVLLGEDGASAAFLRQLLFHLTETERERERESEREGERERGGRERTGGGGGERSGGRNVKSVKDSDVE